ncbi:GGDEF domain-containing protein [Plesiomonas shigelloides subsp. oncorhynchi]|nr:GGDEF domain-containing protein [Plesiomonas shigelloides]
MEHRLDLIAKDVNRDPLTGLPNRASFIHQLSLLPENGAKHWLALIHATPLTELNQRGGSKLGDLFIQEIAEQLTLHGLPLGQLYRFEGAMFAWVASAHQIEQPSVLLSAAPKRWNNWRSATKSHEPPISRLSLSTATSGVPH